MMGANNSSTRKITLVNDEKTGVIKLSESLAHKLRGQIEKNADVPKLPQKPKESPKETYPEKPKPVNESDSFQSINETEVPIWAYSKDSHSLISRLKEEKNNELKLRDEEWRRRLKENEANYIKHTKLTEEELSKTAKQVDGLFKTPFCDSSCDEPKELVQKCYKDNQTQSLRCAEEVETFARCVDSQRLHAITTQ